VTTNNLQAAFNEVVHRVRRATVHVYDRRGRGSGVVWADGLIVSNAHVVREPYPTIETAAGTARGRLIARDDRRDLAAIHVDLRGLGVRAADLRDAATLRAGEFVLAVGNPLGLSGAVASGMLRSAGRRFVVSDVRLAPGNSGGPLTDAAGRVVGINSMVHGASAYAVPSEAVRAFLEEEGFVWRAA